MVGDINMEDIIKRIMDVLNENFEDLINYPNVLNVGISDKTIDGEVVPCIAVFVSKKKTPDELKVANEKMLPKTIDGICTNVVELSTNDYVLGKTTVSRMPFEVQKRLAGGLIPNE